MDAQKEREAFEEWAKASGNGGDLKYYAPRDQYLNLFTQGAWAAWKGRAEKDPTAPVPGVPLATIAHATGAVMVCRDHDAACAEVPVGLRCKGCPVGGGVPEAPSSDEATTDQLLELAGALEQRRALAIVGNVTALGAGFHEGPFRAGYESACEEITLRLRTEVWDGCLPPVDAPKDGVGEVGRG